MIGRHCMVSFAHLQQLDLAFDICQSVALDNGAYPNWKAGRAITNWSGYYRLVERWQHHPRFDFSLIPDVIDGTEDDNHRLVSEWPFSKVAGVPVWHLHESLDYLMSLAEQWPRVALGSSGEYATVGTDRWYSRMGEAMEVLCPSGYPITKLHGLRMLNPAIFTQFPFSSADSTNVSRNIGIDSKWKGTYLPHNKAVRGIVLAERIESFNSAPYWEPTYELAKAMALAERLSIYD